MRKCMFLARQARLATSIQGVMGLNFLLKQFDIILNIIHKTQLQNIYKIN